jgi:hypothetical protein
MVRCLKEYRRHGMARPDPVTARKSKVLKVLKVLNFQGTGRMRIFAAAEGR